MNKIAIYCPCFHVHRLIYPPVSKELYHETFIGGGNVLARMTLELCLEPPPNEESLQSIRHKHQQKFEPIIAAAKNLTKKRILQIGKFRPTPSQKRTTLPDHAFLRVAASQDSKEIASTYHGEFLIEPGHLKTSIIFICGDVWPGDEREIQQVGRIPILPLFYFAAGKLTSNVKHLELIKPSSGSKLVTICHLDITGLSEEFPIQTDTSYERTIGDICRAEAKIEINGSKKKSKILDFVGPASDQFTHMLIRLGNSAVVIISSPDKTNAPPTTQLIYHKDRAAPTRFSGLGEMLGYDLILASCMLSEIAKCDFIGKQANEQRYILERAGRLAVSASFKSFQDGFHKLTPDLEEFDEASLIKPAEDLFTNVILSTRDDTQRDDAQKVFFKDSKECKVNFEAASSPNVFWRIAYNGEAANGKGKTANENQTTSLGIALGHLLHGKRIPIVKIGKLDLVDRHEVEDYLFLQSLLMDYHREKKREKPLSFAVFGQPGAGKSFGVKALVKEMSGEGGFGDDPITINLTQLKSIEELNNAFHEIRDQCLKIPIPLVFFDEFDADFQGKGFGWLKYFLAPMQDGSFLEGGKEYHFGKAIFVFAGGVNHSFAEFNGRSRNPNFCDAKGPDFTSRLRGILNIRGLNKPEGEDIEHVYMLRRAVFLQRLLEDRTGLKKDGIEAKLAEALLRIPRFKHGTRSLEAILDMSRISQGKKFLPSHLPPRDQLDMHVDAREFLQLAEISSARTN